MANSIPRIVITGFMGSGKTAVAQSLAAQRNLEMIDLDKFITDDAGRTPAQIIAQDGEPSFRTIETDALRRLLQTRDVGVIALGGGAWIEQTNRNLIEENDCLTVWLDIPFDECWKRIESSNEERPLGKTEQQARELYDRRRPVYELATLHLKVHANDSPAELAARLNAKLASLNI